MTVADRAGAQDDAGELAPFDQSLAAIVFGAKEAIIAPMRPKLREYAITEPQWRVMRVINDRGATDATDLAEVGLLHAPSVTRILKELEARGLILRERDDQDRRRTVVALTGEGRAVVKDISRHVADVLSAYSDRFGAQRLEQLSQELRALSVAIRGI